MGNKIREKRKNMIRNFNWTDVREILRKRQSEIKRGAMKKKQQEFINAHKVCSLSYKFSSRKKPSPASDRHEFY